MPNPAILVHGYSDIGKSFFNWKAFLEANGYSAVPIHVADYKTLTNEVTIKDIAEAFDRALREQGGLDEGKPFDAIVHSTGMLVVRSWLTTYAYRRNRLKRLIGLAPATWGSPLAHKGRSWLGAIFKGNKDILDPDFMEAGDRVLDALELGSRFTWDLAHVDLFGTDTYYGPSADTPWIFTLCGIDTYDGLRSIVNEPGMDGTVRWAGCSLDSRKIVLDLTRHPGEKGRVWVSEKLAIDAPFVPIGGVNHGTILDPNKSETLQKLILEALQVENEVAFMKWRESAARSTARERALLESDLGRWQQFIVHAVDERGDPVPDYHIELVADGNNPLRKTTEFNVDAHVYRVDPSFRCFHLNLNELNGIDPVALQLRVMASAGSHLVSYAGWTTTGSGGTVRAQMGEWDGILDVGKIPGGVKVFFPFTTTLIELRLNREPRSEVCRIVQP